MTDTENEIIFEDPEDELIENEDEQPLSVEDLLEGDNPDEEVIEEIPQARPDRWQPSGALFPGSELVEDSPRYCVDGQMTNEISPETVDPDSMNFLLKKQKEHLQQDENGPIPVGGSYRDPRPEELEEVLEQGLSCPFCQDPFTEAECDSHDLGQLVSYGGIIYHWSCLALWMLILAKGHAYKAAEIFHCDSRDLRAIKASYRAIPWGRLGYRSPGTEGGR
jgi:hypothetical protein